MGNKTKNKRGPKPPKKKRPPPVPGVVEESDGSGSEDNQSEGEGSGGDEGNDESPTPVIMQDDAPNDDSLPKPPVPTTASLAPNVTSPLTPPATAIDQGLFNFLGLPKQETDLPPSEQQPETDSLQPQQEDTAVRDLLTIIQQISQYDVNRPFPFVAELAKPLEGTTLEPVYRALEPLFGRLFKAESPVMKSVHSTHDAPTVDLSPIHRQCDAIASSVGAVARDADAAAKASALTVQKLDAMMETAGQEHKQVSPPEVADVPIQLKMIEELKSEVQNLRISLSSEVTSLRTAFETVQQLAPPDRHPQAMVHSEESEEASTDLAKMKAELMVAKADMHATERLLAALARGHFDPEAMTDGPDDPPEDVSVASIRRRICMHASKIASQSEQLISALSKNAPTALLIGEDAWRWATGTVEALDKIIWSERLQVYSDFKCLQTVVERLSDGQDPTGDVANDGARLRYPETGLSRKAIGLRDGIIDAANQMAKLKTQVRRFGKKDCAHWH